MANKCTCGASICRHPKHSDWCDSLKPDSTAATVNTDSDNFSDWFTDSFLPIDLVNLKPVKSKSFIK